MTNLEGRPFWLYREHLKPLGERSLGPLTIVESHGDEVSELPEGGALIGTSERTRVEIWRMGD